ncbi:unnamed protein product [Caenorhabditis nigoni]
MLYSDAVNKPAPEEDSFDKFPGGIAYDTREEMSKEIAERKIRLGQNAIPPPPPQQPFDQVMMDFEENFPPMPLATSTPNGSPIKKTEINKGNSGTI